MRFLLLLFSILWGAHSLRQLKPDYLQCTTFYFCLLPRSTTKTGSGDDLVVPTADLHGSDPPEIAILIKPLTKQKWIFIIIAKVRDLSRSNGIRISSVGKTTSAGLLPNEILSGTVVGCGDKGLMYNPSSLLYEARQDESDFATEHQLTCVGMLTSKDSSSEIAGILNGAQSAANNGNKLLVVYSIGLNYKQRELRTADELTAGETFDFNDVLKYRLSCDFDMLKPPIYSLSRGHRPREMIIYSNTIDCAKANLFDPSSDTHELLIQPTGSNEFKKIGKISCERNSLNYYEEGSSTPNLITTDVKVACGVRITCAKLAPVKKCDEQICTPSSCNADKCEKNECDGNRWIINDKTPYVGLVECERESVDLSTKPHWYATSHKERVQVGEGSCNKKIDCHIASKVHTRCENRDNCFKATIGPTAVYCPKHYDMMYFDGKDNYFDEKFRCDSDSGKWTPNHIYTSTQYVFCLYNASKENQILGGAPIVVKKPEKGLTRYEPYMLGVIGTLVGTYITTLLVFITIRSVKKYKRRKEFERKKDRKLWTRDENYRQRPINKEPGISELKLCHKDLKKIKCKAISEGLQLDFSLYCAEEREKFLEKVLPEFGTGGSRLIRMTIPLLAKCTENDRLGNCEYQPLHPATVRIAFLILKVLSGCFGHRGDADNDKRIRKAIATTATNITHKIRMERVRTESEDVTLIRMHAIEAQLYAEDPVTFEWLLKIFRDTKDCRLTETPLRKYVWASGIRHGGANQTFENVKSWFDEEVAMVKAGKQHSDDTRFGTRLEHYIFALCAADRTKSESFLNYVIKDPFFTAKHIMAGFQAMIEVFDENQVTARFLFMERHNFIKEKMAPSSPEYLQLYRWMYTYLIYFPARETWLWQHVTGEGNFTLEEKQKLDISKSTTFGGIYSVVYKWTDVVDIIEYELTEKEFVKANEMKPEPGIIQEENSDEWYDPDNPLDMERRKRKEEERKKRAEESEKDHEKRKEKKRLEREKEMERRMKKAMRTARELDNGWETQVLVNKKPRKDEPAPAPTPKISSLKEQTAVDDGSGGGGGGPLEKTQSEPRSHSSGPLEKTQPSVEAPPTSSPNEKPGPAAK